MITIRTILVPTDLSAASVPAIAYAAFLGKAHDSEVALLHVVPMGANKGHFTDNYADGVGFALGNQPAGRLQHDVEDIYEPKKQILLGFLDHSIGAELRKTTKFRPLIRPGKVFEEIIAAAKEEKCDLIVMTKQAGNLRRLFGGSITERIVRHAPCPVLSIQPSAEVRTENNERLPVKLTDRWAA
jgi:nucleotide-binding universal stress UspA family protein